MISLCRSVVWRIRRQDRLIVATMLVADFVHWKGRRLALSISM